MRMILVAASLAMLAACGTGASDQNAANGTSAANEASNATNTASASPDAAALAGYRAEAIAECTDDVRGEAPEGADVSGLCGCAIDRHMAGKTFEQLEHGSEEGARAMLEQCATEMGISQRR